MQDYSDNASNSCPHSSIGDSFDPHSPAYQANPHAFYAQARQAEPVFFSPRLNTWVITRYEDAKIVLHNPLRFSSAGATESIANYTPEAQAILSTGQPFLVHSVTNVDPPQQTRIRGVVNKAFSAQRVTRYAPTVRKTEPVELGGITLPRGARIFVGISSANHDETQFPDPEEFRPERDSLGRHMAFGNGIHFCLGAPLARLITRIALETLSTRLPDLHLLPNQQLTYKRSVLMHSLTHLLATTTPNAASIGQE